MSVELLIAPAAAGKTQACIQRIQELRAAQPLAGVWVLVPDSRKAAYFRWRLAAAGGGMGVHLCTFRDLYTEVLEENGVFTPVITPALRHRLVQETVERAAEAGELVHYRSIQQKPGFIQALQDAFAELRSGWVRPERFLETARSAAPAQRELALLYARFLARLTELNWIDPEGQGWLAVSALENHSQAAARVPLAAVDGFTSFNNVQIRFLQLLAQQADSLLITLPGQRGARRPVHRRTEMVQETLVSRLSPRITWLTEPPRLPPVSRTLEQRALDPGKFEKASPPRPFLLEARSQAEEAREALRWIKALHLREGVPLSDCTVFVSSLAAYQPLLRAAAQEFGVPVHFSQAEPLAESPAVMALLTLLSLPAEGFKTRAVLNTLRSPYFDFGLDPKALEELELVSQQACVVMGREQWDEAWQMLRRDTRPTSDALDDERQPSDPTRGIDLPSLKTAFDGFWRIFDSLPGEQSQTEWAAWLENLLERLSFYQRIDSERDQLACQSLTDALQALVLSESVAGARRIGFAQFLTDLQAALNGARLEELGDARQGALFVGEMIAARASRCYAAALLGFSEGLFPAVENPDPFLDEELRRALGLESRLQREQANLFYQAVTRADKHLLLTRPYLSDDGEQWEASPYWLTAKSLFTDDALLRIGQSACRPQADAASAQELLFWGVQQGGLRIQGDSQLAARWQDLDHARLILDARRAKSARGAYEGDAGRAAASLAELYSPRYIWSASRLESYGTCPFKFYVETTLKLEAKTPPKFGLDAAQMGSIFHRVLELVYARSCQEQLSPLDILEEEAGKVFRSAPRVYGFRPSPLWQVEQAEYIETLRQTIQALDEISLDWTPIGFEYQFGIGGSPMLVIRLGEEQVRLHGIIDRVDRNGKGQIRVIDYKSGCANLERSDFLSGRRLQLPIYALAAENALRLGEVSDGFYWMIRQAKASSFKLSRFKTDQEDGPQAAYSLVVAHIQRILAGVRSGAFAPKPPKGGCPSYCPAAQWCWRCQPGF